MTYTTEGNVRGSCGHKHRSIDTAVKCVLRDQKGCAQQGGYSDRYVVNSDGSLLSDADYEYMLDCEMFFNTTGG